jgi:hypothetical protein
VKPECVLVAVVTCLALMSATPALAVPRQIEDFCFEQARYVTFFSQRGAYEAFMANCIANLTPTEHHNRSSRFQSVGDGSRGRRHYSFRLFRS